MAVNLTTQCKWEGRELDTKMESHQVRNQFLSIIFEYMLGLNWKSKPPDSDIRRK
jgi:hypothetical protein